MKYAHRPDEKSLKSPTSGMNVHDHIGEPKSASDYSDGKDDFDGKGTSFQFKKIGKWGTWTVANSWTNPNPYVSSGYTKAPMKYVKRYV